MILFTKVIPLGYMSENKKLIINENTAPIVVKVFELYSNGQSIKEIIGYMNERQYKTSTGSKFTYNGLHTILRNKKYIGYYVYGDIEIEDGVPRIVSDETFNKVQTLMNNNRKTPARAKAITEYILMTKLFCGRCKGLMVGVSGKGKCGVVYNYYSCNTSRKKQCKKKMFAKIILKTS